MPRDKKTECKFRMRKRPVQNRGRDRINDIIEAAEALLLEKGLLGLRVREIARRANTNIATVYQYFPGQDAITRHIVEKYNAEMKVALAPAIQAAATDDPEGSLLRLQNAAFEFYRARPVTREIWPGIQAEQDLRKLDRHDSEETSQLVGLLLDTLCPGLPAPELTALARYVVYASAPVFRLAVDLPPAESERVLAAQFDAILALVKKNRART